jgi:hypothetical protein
VSIEAQPLTSRRGLFHWQPQPDASRCPCSRVAICISAPGLIGRIVISEPVRARESR